MILKEEFETNVKLHCECGERLSAVCHRINEICCSGYDPFGSPIESKKCVGVITLYCKKCIRPVANTNICQILHLPKTYKICSYIGDDCREKTKRYIEEFCKRHNLEQYNGACVIKFF